METNRLEIFLHLFLAGLVVAALMLFVRQTQTQVYTGEAVSDLPEIVVHAYSPTLARHATRLLT